MLEKFLSSIKCTFERLYFKHAPVLYFYVVLSCFTIHICLFPFVAPDTCALDSYSALDMSHLCSTQYMTGPSHILVFSKKGARRIGRNEDVKE